jgi:hypothetical protein
MKLIIRCLVVSLFFFACSKNDDIVVGDEQKLETLGKEIEEFAKNKSCSGDDCRTMAMGAKGCGGPTKYLVYALSKVDEKQLTEKVKVYTDLQKKINAETNKISDCSLVVAPIVNCLNGVCTAK